MKDKKKLEEFRSIIINKLEGESDPDKLVKLLYLISSTNEIMPYLPE